MIGTPVKLHGGYCPFGFSIYAVDVDGNHQELYNQFNDRKDPKKQNFVMKSEKYIYLERVRRLCEDKIKQMSLDKNLPYDMGKETGYESQLLLAPDDFSEIHCDIWKSANHRGVAKWGFMVSDVNSKTSTFVINEIESDKYPETQMDFLRVIVKSVESNAVIAKYLDWIEDEREPIYINDEKFDWDSDSMVAYIIRHR